MRFFQEPPRLGNQYDDDAILGEYVARSGLATSCIEELRHLGGLAGGPLYELQLRDRLNEPRLTQWDPWGHRVDHVELTPLWQEASRLAAQHGLVATAYEPEHGPLARVLQMLKMYMVDASLDVYSCPLSMTDGAARTLLDHRNPRLIERALPHLTSRDPARMWTSGQWMTERTGGSDVGISETVAHPPEPGSGDDHFRLEGVKWFTSAVTSQMALTLARPIGNESRKGGSGLALFYLEVRDAQGRLNGISVNRLKDKLGTRKVPTAELTLLGTRALPVIGLTDGVKNITPMLNITRIWNALGSIANMRRSLALARDYAQRRVAFGNPLAQKPLHLDTLAGMQAEFEGAFVFTMRAVELLGRSERGGATPGEELLRRLVTPIVKLLTAKQAMSVVSEALEACGGAGYVEDTGLPRLLRDTQVLPIWEGTTNVLSLDVLRVLKQEAGLAPATKGSPLAAFDDELKALLGAARDPALRPCVVAVEQAMAHARAWLDRSRGELPRLEAGARRFALTLGRTYETALLSAHAQWCLDHNHGKRSLLAARRLVRHGIDLITAPGPDEDDDIRLLALSPTP